VPTQHRSQPPVLVAEPLVHPSPRGIWRRGGGTGWSHPSYDEQARNGRRLLCLLSIWGYRGTVANCVQNWTRSPVFWPISRLVPLSSC